VTPFSRLNESRNIQKRRKTKIDALEGIQDYFMQYRQTGLMIPMQPKVLSL
jgi:hypothetical protein